MRNGLATIAPSFSYAIVAFIHQKSLFVKNEDHCAFLDGEDFL
jgi:hypothetical protein